VERHVSRNVGGRNWEDISLKTFCIRKTFLKTAYMKSGKQIFRNSAERGKTALETAYIKGAETYI
jgi:hypothetical protein